MNTYAIFGMQWGDEGKGKAVDFLAQDANVIVRYQGGNNAGHTIVVNGQKTVLKLLPSGVLNTNATCVLSHGMVIDPKVFLKEIEDLETKGLTTQHILISERAHIIMPYHLIMDEIQEGNANTKIGTTKKGIGPCYENKFRRTGIRAIDLIHPEKLKQKIKINLEYYNLIFKALNLEELNLETVFSEYKTLGEKISFRVKETSPLLLNAVKQNEKVIFEGAQATLLDIDDGMYPFVTSSHPSLGGIGSGTSIPPHYIKNRIGILKAYTSKVGEGPFPTEQINETGEFLRSKGNEFGSVTGRPRRCGWLDLVLSRYTKEINDINHLVVTKFDILSGLKKIYAAVQYKYKGSVLNEIPNDPDIFNKIEIIYKEFDGFTLEEGKIYEGFESLPNTAKEYLNFVEKTLEVPLLFVSVGAERKENVWKNTI